MIPNTTPTPNELYNGEMKKMSDTELRVVLIVTRATLGWEEDKETKMRKKEDWISYYQLKQKSGRGYTALAKAIDNCIKKGWIEARDKNGNLLDTKNKRIGQKIFYRLGQVFLDKIETTSSESEGVKTPTSSESVITESVITESEAYKINPLQNKSFTKDYISNASVAEIPLIKKERKDQDIFDIIELFKDINPSYERFFSDKSQRAAAQRLLKIWGKEKLIQIISCLSKTNKIKYAPTITTICQLEQKIGSLIAFIQKEKGELAKNKILKI